MIVRLQPLLWIAGFIVSAVAVIAATATITVDVSTTIGVVPSGQRCIVAHPFLFAEGSRIDINGDGAEDTIANWTWYRDRALEAGFNCLRSDLPWKDNTQTIGNTTNVTEANFKNTTSNYASHNGTLTQIAWALSQGWDVYLDAPTMPAGLANLSQNCTSQSSTCPPSNHAVYASLVKQELVMLYKYAGLTPANSHLLHMGGRNEVGIAANKYFLRDADTSSGAYPTTCGEFTRAIMPELNDTFNAVDEFNSEYGMQVGKMLASTYTLREYGTAEERCNANITAAMVGNFSNRNVTFNFHDYFNNSETDAFDPVTFADIKHTAIRDAVRGTNVGQDSFWGEFSDFSGAIQIPQGAQYYWDLYGVHLRTISFVDDNVTIATFDGACITNHTGSNCSLPEHFDTFSEPRLDNNLFVPWYVNRDLNWTFPPGSLLVNTTSDDPLVVGLCSKNSTNGNIRCGVIYLGNNTRDINVTFSNAGNITAALEANSSQTFTVYNNVTVQTDTLQRFGVRNFNLTTVQASGGGGGGAGSYSNGFPAFIGGYIVLRNGVPVIVQ